MPIGDTLIAILNSFQDPRLRRVGAGVRRAAGPVVHGARRRLAASLTRRPARS